MAKAGIKSINMTISIRNAVVINAFRCALQKERISILFNDKVIINLLSTFLNKKEYIKSRKTSYFSKIYWYRSRCNWCIPISNGL